MSRHPEELRAPFGIQAALFGLLLLAFVFGSHASLGSWVPALVGVTLAATAIALGRRSAPRSESRRVLEPVAIGLGSSFLIFVVGLEYRFPVTKAWGLQTMALSFSVLGAWALSRMRSSEARWSGHLTHETRTRAFQGLFVGLGFCVIATGLIGVMRLGGANNELVTLKGWGLLMVSYLVGGAVTGALVGLLRPVMRWPFTRMLAGVLLAGVAYTSVGLAMFLLGSSRGPHSLAGVLGVGAILGLILGPSVALGFHAAGALSGARYANPRLR